MNEKSRRRAILRRLFAICMAGIDLSLPNWNTEIIHLEFAPDGALSCN
jgi:hypothetical protein